MKTSEFREEQIAFALKQGDANQYPASYEFASRCSLSKFSLASRKRSAFSTIQAHSGTMRTSNSMPVSDSSYSTLGGISSKS